MWIKQAYTRYPYWPISMFADSKIMYMIPTP